MQCKSVLMRIDARRTGELDPSERWQIDDHLERCESCHDSASDVEQFAGVVRSLTPPHLSSCYSKLCDAISDSLDSFEVSGRTAWVAFSSRGLRMIDVKASSEPEFRELYCRRFGRSLQRRELSSRLREAIAASIRGEAATLPEVDLTGLTPFEQLVLQTIAKIPRGEVRTYEWVAQAVGKPKAARAVGNVMASNPIPFVLPCHRVVPTAGGVGSYGYGSERKREILRSEGAPIDELEQLARQGVRYVGSATTHIFCVPTCRDARRIRPDNRVAFQTANEALRTGFRPCRRCEPVALTA